MKYIIALALGVAFTACGGGKDATSSCKDLCTTAGFTSSRVDTQPKEVNCFCSGGTGTVTAAACTSMCTGVGKAKSQVFGQSAGASDACQCE